MLTATDATKHLHGFTWRVFLVTSTLVGVVVASALLIASASVRRTSAESARRGVEQAADVAAQFLSGRERSLAAGVSVFVQRPYFRTLVSDRRRVDVLDQTLEAVSQLQSQWVFITDARGILLAKSDEPMASGDDLSHVPLLSGALRGQVTSGFGVSRDSILFQAVAVPIVIPSGNPVGVLVATRVLDSLLAHDLAAASGSEVVFFTRGLDGTVRITASTIGKDPAVTTALRRLVAASSRVDRTDSVPPRVNVLGDEYIAQRASLTTAGGEVIGGFAVLRSRNAERSSLAGVQRSIVSAGIVGFLLTLLVAYVAARFVARPVRSLAGVVVRAADGDYRTTITSSLADSGAGAEMTGLASAFDALLADLRDKEALIAMTRDASRAPTAAPASRETGHRQPRRLRVAGGALSIADPHPHSGLTRSVAVSVGTILASRYRIEALIGSGGMGMVYRAHDRIVGETIAIKLLRPEVVAVDPAAYERMQGELRLARRVTHRNVVRMHDFGEVGGIPFLTMEFVDGTSLAEAIRAQGALAPGIIVAIAKQLLRAIAAAHDQQIVHGDIKPQNLLIGSNGVLKVSDFGVARVVRDPWRGADGASARPVIASADHIAGAVAGTPEYMAPEQLIGGGATVHSDIYAAGIVLYEMLTGVTPYGADTPMAFFARKFDPRDTSARWPASHAGAGATDDALVQLIAQMTALGVDARPHSARELVARFGALH